MWEPDASAREAPRISRFDPRLRVGLPAPSAGEGTGGPHARHGFVCRRFDADNYSLEKEPAGPTGRRAHCPRRRHSAGRIVPAAGAKMQRSSMEFVKYIARPPISKQLGSGNAKLTRAARRLS